MEISSNYSITHLFLDKVITISVDGRPTVKINLPTIRLLYNNPQWNMTYHLFTKSPKELAKNFGLVQDDITEFDILQLILFDLGKYNQFKNVYNIYYNGLKLLFNDFKIELNKRIISVEDTIITTEIWNYIIYLLKLSCGEKVEKPIIFTSEEARKFYLAQKEQEDKIKQIKNQTVKDEDGLMKCVLSIIYSFPSLTVEYLLDQTMAQIQWLQKYAAGAVSYEVNAQAFAAGNVKKGKKLDFFIK